VGKQKLYFPGNRIAGRTQRSDRLVLEGRIYHSPPSWLPESKNTNFPMLEGSANIAGKISNGKAFTLLNNDFIEGSVNIARQIF
jgi:hypothetical protein